MSGLVIKSFDSSADCAKYLEVSPMTVHQRLRKGKSFLYHGKLISIKRSASGLEGEDILNSI